MANILEESKMVEEVEYRREFVNTVWPDSGFTFPVDEKTMEVVLNDANRENYERCLREPQRYLDQGIVKRTNSYRLPALLQCDCGEKFRLYNTYMGASQCPECGLWYNMFGEELKEPSEWERDY